ncbi:hypothetical protein XA68_14508 [Ophiocordyceps unilateralis]|uniref:Uncharacterized protein n=1 Tax=Ophiocordyceps unilateralis TaxID=268505 RepID=A0A2A9PLI8_OPHUN|nr:hypothetical protein XA68_14508 [Ophiocordyceps unilateralis]
MGDMAKRTYVCICGPDPAGFNMPFVIPPSPRRAPSSFGAVCHVIMGYTVDVRAPALSTGSILSSKS